MPDSGRKFLGGSFAVGTMNGWNCGGDNVITFWNFVEIDDAQPRI